MEDINERLRDLVERRRHLPGSIAVMETSGEAERINSDLCGLESYTMRLAACWDGELDAIGAFSQLAYLHEKAGAAEQAAAAIREAVERLTGWEPPAADDLDDDDGPG
jgi:hypothetical protein